MLDLLGKATFTAEQISAMRSALDQYGLPMPQFRRIGGKKFTFICFVSVKVILDSGLV